MQTTHHCGEDTSETHSVYNRVARVTVQHVVSIASILIAKDAPAHQITLSITRLGALTKLFKS
jgi:hypothetical protein